MEQAALPADRVRDPLERNVPGVGIGRDGCRTPMQWDESSNAGFCAGAPWLPVPETFREHNVAAQRKDPRSTFQRYRRLVTVRRKRVALVLGAYRPLVAGGDLLLYVRELADERLLIALNFGGEPIAARFTSGNLAGRLMLSSHGDRDDEPVTGGVDLRGHEGVVVELSRASALPECDGAGTVST